DPALEGAGSRYRVALARVLLRSAGNAPAPPRSVPPARRLGLSPREAVWMLLFAFQAPGLAGEAPGPREAERLADEVLAPGDKVPFDVRAQALAIKGLYTRALTEYTNGLRQRGLLAPEYANSLLELIASHPSLRRPEGRTIADPAAGERHYALGLNYFFAR